MPNKLEKSGNPYAMIPAPEGVDEVSVPKIWTSSGQLGLPLTEESIAQAKSPTSGSADLIEIKSHPYAIADRETESKPIRIRVPEKLSKKDFRSGCTDFFLQYIPPEEGKKLRPHYRAFINRNENRSSAARSAILRELLKYDFSDVGSLSPHFNREGDPITEAKLRAIEEKFLDLE